MRSHRKAAAAQAAGKFKDEIVPVHTKVGLVCRRQWGVQVITGMQPVVQRCCIFFCPASYPHPNPPQLIDPKSGAQTNVVVSEDDGIRGSTTLESLSALPTVFKKNGTTTAGTSSQVG